MYFNFTYHIYACNLPPINWASFSDAANQKIIIYGSVSPCFTILS